MHMSCMKAKIMENCLSGVAWGHSLRTHRCQSASALIFKALKHKKKHGNDNKEKNIHSKLTLNMIVKSHNHMLVSLSTYRQTDRCMWLCRPRMPRRPAWLVHVPADVHEIKRKAQNKGLLTWFFGRGLRRRRLGFRNFRFRSST